MFKKIPLIEKIIALLTFAQPPRKPDGFQRRVSHTYVT